MADLLDDTAVSTALEALPGWGGDHAALTRTVDVATADRPAFKAAVADVGNEMDHHADVDEAGDGVVLRLSTHSEGGVTSKDIDLAARLDQLMSGTRTWKG
jgi:4a-hydroxytetrahydrobiopterin dehydratase